MKDRCERRNRFTVCCSTAARLLTLALCACGLAAPGHAAPAPEDPAAAAVLVNGTAITMGAYRKELESATQVQEAKAKLAHDAMMARVKQETLDNMITRELLYQESRRRNIAVDAATVDREYKQYKANFASEAQYVETLTRLKLSEAQVREQIAQGIAIRTLIEEAVGKKVTVTPEEARNYYDRNAAAFAQPPRVHLSHILIALAKDATKEQKKAAADKIAEVQKRVARGDDFSALAAQYSDDAKNRTRGGDIGWFTSEQMPAEMHAKVKNLKVGDVSAVVEDRFGLHVIKVMESRAAFTPTFDELKDRIMATVRQEKAEKELQPFVKQLRDRAKVEIRLPEDNS
ncbi:peptidylprolyl isomerase [Geobacter sp. AOG2]|uniref:peptidylprolyl isomerase n=1 Tax=Geobacter sp. AOG2 TaxID=1566347 RepID=UPI001CC5C523|nr:peptidylprolyl isomerase [Geobacter sp. AOG2]GFE62027.1 peptidylprolyl isomerase [Geobacter sp. AOG2]